MLTLYKPEHALQPFGMQNTGAICYLNSMLQGLFGATAFVDRVLSSRGYLAQTNTGCALYDCVWHAVHASGHSPHAPEEQPFAPRGNVNDQSARMLAALISDLRERRPDFKFGNGQQSASECFALLLDMTSPIEPRPTPPRPNPIADLFYSRYVNTITCPTCRKSIETTDVSLQFEMFGQTASLTTDSASFAARVRESHAPLEDWCCEACGSKPDHDIYSRSQLRMIGDIAMFVFNLYTARADTHYFPDRFSLPGLGGAAINYRLVSQVEHSGDLNSGHYTATSLRRTAEGAPTAVLFSDMSTSDGKLGPRNGVYLAIYQPE